MSDSNAVAFDIAPFDFASLMETQKAAVSDSSKAFPCADCGKVFHHSSSLGRHRIQKHSIEYVCQLCQARSENADDIRSHLNAVHGFVKPMACRCHEWMFAELASLNVHIKVFKETGVHPENIQVLAKPANSERNAKSVQSEPRPAAPPAKRRKVSKATAKRLATDETPASDTRPNPIRSGVLNKLAAALMQAQSIEAADHLPTMKKEPSIPTEVNNNENTVDEEENSDSLGMHALKTAAPVKINKRKAFVPVQIKMEEGGASEAPSAKKHADEAKNEAVLEAQPIAFDAMPVKIKAEADDDCESSLPQDQISEAKMQALLAAQLVPRDAPPELKKLVEELVQNIQ